VRLLTTLEAEGSFAHIAFRITTDIRKHPPAASESDLPAPRAGAPTSHATHLDERLKLITFELGKEIGHCSPNLLLGDEFIATSLRASLANAVWSLLEGTAYESVPTSLAELMSARHANHLVGIEAILVHTNFTNPPFACDASITAGVPRMSTSGQNATFLLDPIWIVEEGLEKALLLPLVFTQQNRSGAGRGAEDLRGLSDLIVHYRPQFVDGKHAYSKSVCCR
jgi:hypothetical protein